MEGVQSVIRAVAAMIALLPFGAAFGESGIQLVWTKRFGGYIAFDEATLHPRIADKASSISVDRAGNTYVVGTAVTSGSIPLVRPVQGSCGSNHCIFVTKFAPDGQTVLYSTYIGYPAAPFGWPLYDGGATIPASIVADPEGNVYLTGAAFRLPQVAGGTVQSAGANDVFVVKLDTNGALTATLLAGGSGDDQGTSISLGADGYLYVAGTTQSNDFPESPGAYRTPATGPTKFFSLKIDPKAFNGDAQFSRAVVYSSVFGTYSQLRSNSGSTFAAPQIGADSLGNAYVSIYTDCTGIEATPGALRTNCQPEALGSVGVVAKINPSGTKLLWVAMPTGSGRTYIRGIAVSAQGFTYAAGMTQSADFPVTPGAFTTTAPTTRDFRAFVAKLSPEGTELAYATYLGDSGWTSDLMAIAVDRGGNAYVSGGTASVKFPMLNSIQSGLGHCCAGFVSVFKPDGSALVWSTLLGTDASVDALTLDEGGNVYAAGFGIDPSVGVSPYGGTIAVAKIAPGALTIPIDAITNAASFQSGLPQSGGLASMFVHGLNISGALLAPVPLPLELGGVSIRVNGIPAPILSVSSLSATGPTDSKQINFQVPFEASVTAFTSRLGFSVLSATSVELRYQGKSSFAMPTTTPPGIFTLPDGSGAVQHGSDYTLVSPGSPVAPGENIIVYVTGLGPVRPAVLPGSVATAPAPIFGYCYTPPTVNVGDVLYAGLTPGFPGLYQMNVRLSPSLPSGMAQMYVSWTDCEYTTSRAFPVIYVRSKSNSVVLPVR